MRGDYTIQLALYDLLIYGKPVLIGCANAKKFIESFKKEKNMSKNLTKKVRLANWNRGEETTVVDFDDKQIIVTEPTRTVGHLYPKIMTHSGPYPWGSKEMNDRIKKVRDSVDALRYSIHRINYDEPNPTLPKIEDVRFNDPATIVFWADGTKTVVKAQPGETYDPEKGLAMAISKKALGNNHDYYIPFKKYLKKYYKGKKED